MGTLSLILAPLLFVFLILHFFFKYAQTYHKDPASLGARQYSPLARWKFREFNELDHILNLRLNRSYTKAVSYLNQFPQEHIIIYAKWDTVMRCSSLKKVFLTGRPATGSFHSWQVHSRRSFSLLQFSIKTCYTTLRSLQGTLRFSTSPCLVDWPRHRMP